MNETASQYERIRESIEKIPVGICVYQRLGEEIRCVASNARYTQLLGLEIGEPLDQPLEEFFKLTHPDDRAKCREEITAQMASNRSGGGTYRIYSRALDDYRWFRLDGHLAEQPDGNHFAYFTYLDVSETVAAREALERSRQAMNSIIQYAPGGVFVYSAEDDDEFSFVSENMLAMLGYTPEEFREKFHNQFSQMIYEEDRAATLKSIWDQVALGSFDTCIYRIEKRDGSLMRVHDEGHLITDEHGKRWFYVVIVDITSLERSREESFNRILQELLVTNPNALCTFRLNLSRNQCSDSHGTSEYLRQLSGAATADELLQKFAAVIVDGKDAARFLADFSRDGLLKQFEGGTDRSETTYRRLTGSGKVRWVTTCFHVLQNPYTKDVEAIVYSVDADRAHKEAQIVSVITREEYECIGLVDVATRDVTYYYISESYRKRGWLLPESYDERIRHIGGHLPSEREKQAYQNEVSLEAVRAALETRAVYTYAYSCGDRRKQVTFRYLEEDRREIMFALADITESFEHEEAYARQLRTALDAAEQASVAKSEFLSRMSHEIRTPMNAIIGLDAIALQETGISAATEDHLRKIGISARFLLALINDILDMSRIESGKMMLRNEAFNFEEFIGGINTILYEQCRTSDLDYECVLKSFTEEEYVGDKTKLQQVLINILGNAVKFTPKGGKVRFLVEQLSRTRTKAKLRFEISDTGIGMEASFLPHLFEAFSQENRGRTARYGGTGLGLAISRNIVRLMDGDIAVHSIKGVGSQFTVEVEMALPDDAIRRREFLRRDCVRPLNTLIVDDDVIVCQHTHLLLTDAGFQAEWAVSGEEAVRKVVSGHHAGRDYDLVLLDWKMPEMDGIETAREIRKIVGPEVTIIIMTAYDWADIEEKARAAGVDLFMRKPVFPSSVTSAFERVFQKKGADLEPQETPDFDFSGKRLLLAEDNEINAEIARYLLELKHGTVDVAENGVAAIEAFYGNPVGHYDAILMDVRMPVMDGLETTRTIRAMKKADAKTIPILAMTANAFQEDVDASLRAGMNAHLAKPIEPRVLYETLARYLK